MFILDFVEFVFGCGKLNCETGESTVAVAVDEVGGRRRGMDFVFEATELALKKMYVVLLFNNGSRNDGSERRVSAERDGGVGTIEDVVGEDVCIGVDEGLMMDGEKRKASFNIVESGGDGGERLVSEGAKKIPVGTVDRPA